MGIYGQTEVTGPATVITGEDYFSKPYSCGKPMREIDLQIWDEMMRPAPAGSVAEIMIRSKTCIPGYWNNDAANQSLYTGEWLHTGDLARIDEDGFVYFMDRKKELIKTGGENVYPREVEDVLRAHPAIADIAVIGLADPGGWGEKVTAVIILKAGYALSLDQVKAHCRNKIAGYKIPKELKIVSGAGDITTARHHLSKNRCNMGANIIGIHKGKNLLNGNSALKAKAIAKIRSVLRLGPIYSGPSIYRRSMSYLSIKSSYDSFILELILCLVPFETQQSKGTLSGS